jgi:hypothetical protein
VFNEEEATMRAWKWMMMISGAGLVLAFGLLFVDGARDERDHKECARLYAPDMVAYRIQCLADMRRSR